MKPSRSFFENQPWLRSSPEPFPLRLPFGCAPMNVPSCSSSSDCEHDDRAERERESRTKEQDLITEDRAAEADEYPTADDRRDDRRNVGTKPPDAEIARHVAQLRYRIDRERPRAREDAAVSEAEQQREDVDEVHARR